MANLIKRSFLIAFVLLTLFACSGIGGFFSGTTEEEINADNDGYGSLIISIPTYRGWTIDNYTITATKPGETPVVAETSSTEVNIRLKIGTWNINVEGTDTYDNVIYQGISTATVTETTTNMTVGLLKRAGNYKINISNFTGYNVLSGSPGYIEKITVTASRTDGFPSVIQEVDNFASAAVFTGLAQGNWNFLVEGKSSKLNSDYTTISGQYDTYVSGSFVGEVLASRYVTSAYTISGQVKATPVKFSHSTGSYSSSFLLSLSCDTPAVTIRYTTNGDDPSTTGTVYSVPISIDAGKTVKAIAVKTGMANSVVGARTYTINTLATSTPQFSPTGGTFSAGLGVTITCADSGAVIYYTTNGTNPTTSSAQYSAPIAVSGDGTVRTIKAMALASGKTASDVVTQVYTITYPQAAAPVITPPSGTYDTDALFSLESGTSGASIYYTIDGTTPTTSSILYTNPFSLTEGSKTVKAFATATGYRNSLVTTTTFTINPTDADNSIAFRTTDLVIIAEQTDDIWTTKDLETGVSWFGFENGIAGDNSFTVEWSSGFVGTVELYNNNMTTAIATSGSGNYKVALLTGNSDIPVNYFIKVNSSYTHTGFKIRVYQGGTAPATTTTIYTTTTTTTTIPTNSLKIYYYSTTAPTVWIWEDGGVAISQSMGFSWPGPAMTAVAGYTNWWVFEIPGTYAPFTKALKMKFNEGAEISRNPPATGWYKNSAWTDTCPDTPSTTTTTSVSTSTTTTVSTSTTTTTNGSGWAIPQNLNRTTYPYTNEVILQGFYWYIGDPGSANQSAESNLYQLYKTNATQYHNDGFTAIWMPPSGKAFSPGTDFNVGYAVYDHYDLGEFDQEGSVRTKYGTRGELIEAIDAFHANGTKAIADIVMNHMLGAASSTMMAVSQSIPAGITSVEAYLNFNFTKPGDVNPRGTTYSNFVWGPQHFDGMESYGNYYLFSGHTLDNVNIFTGENLFQSDIILGADVDLQNAEVKTEMTNWSKWLTDALNLDGYRVDAIRHMDNTFVRDWAVEMKNYVTAKSGNPPIIFGENWDGWSARLNAYAYSAPTGGSQTYTGGTYNGIQNSMQLFDVPLHYTFQKIAGENTEPGDMTMLLDANLAANSLLGAKPDYSITFVDNHDTVPTQSLASYIPFDFKLQSYAFILLHMSGTPCVYYRDIYKGNYVSQYVSDHFTELNTGIKQLIDIRHKYGYGAGHTPTNAQPNNADILAYAREGATTGTYAGKSLVFVIAKPGVTGSQWIDTYQASGTFVQIAGDSIGATTSTQANNWGEFSVGAKGYSVWVEQ